MIFEAKKPSGPDYTLTGNLNRHGKRGSRPHVPCQKVAQMAVTNANGSSNSPLREANGPEGLPCLIHAPQYAAILQASQEAASQLSLGSMQNVGMAKHWPYAQSFDALYRDYLDRTGASVEDVAKALGKSRGTVNSYRRKHDAITPDNETILKMAALFGCDVFELMPDFRAITASGQDIAKLTDLDIYRISEGARMVTDPDASQEERDMMVQAMREFQEKMARLKKTRP